MSPIYRIAYIYFVSQEKHFSLREGLDSLTGRIFFRGNPETPAPLPSICQGVRGFFIFKISIPLDISLKVPLQWC